MASSSSPHSYGRLHSPNVADPKRRYHENSPSVHSEHHASLSPHDHWAVSVAPEPQDQISSAGLNNAVTTTVDSGQWVDYGALANEQFLRNDYTYDPYANTTSPATNEFGMYPDNLYGTLLPSGDQSAHPQDPAYIDNAVLNNWETVSGAENYQNLVYADPNAGGLPVMDDAQWMNNELLSTMAAYGVDPAQQHYPEDHNQQHTGLYNPTYQEQQPQAQLTSFNPKGPALPPLSTDDILSFFRKHYASMLNNIPPPTHHTPDQNGDFWCRFCQPKKPVNQALYRQHKLEVHGVNYDTGHQYKPPMDVRYLENMAGCEGFCPSCELWIPLDMNRPVGFNWEHHAQGCQDNIQMMRYLSSDSADEAPIDHIAREAKRMARKQQGLTERYLAGTAGSVWGSSSSNSNSNSVSSGNSGSSAGSAHSGSTVASFGSIQMESSLHNRRKKALRLQKRRGAKNSNPNARVYQCTFCISDFVSFGDWRRHEENVHLVLNKWVCAPEGRFKPGTQECVYCETVHEENDGTMNNKCNDKYCHNKPPADRVFSRKDHLKQHLRRVHGVQWRANFEQWSIKSTGPTRSRCGFCDITFEDWNTRMHHIGYEFKVAGHRMAFWQGEWGLDKIWMSEEKLGNAVLPHEREDHVPRSSKNPEQSSSKRHSKNPAVMKNKLAQSKNSANTKPHSLQRKAGFNQLRSGEKQELSSHPESTPDLYQEFLKEQYLPEQYPEQQLQFHSPPQAQFQSPPQTHGFQPQGYPQDPRSRQQPPFPKLEHEHQYQNIAPMQTVSTPPHSLLSPPDSTQNSADVTPIVPAAAMHSCLYCGKRYTRQDNLRRHAKGCTQAWNASQNWLAGEG